MIIPEGVKIQHYELILNEDCNMRCKYCFDDIYSGRKPIDIKTKMDLNMIDDIFNFIIKTRDEKVITRISFFGGEPLTNWEFISEFLDRSDNFGFITSYGMTTNGTLLNKEKIDKLLKYNVGIGISIDGGKEAHNKKRIFPDGT